MSYTYFPMNRPLVTMTHVCRSWRNVLVSTPSLWTQLDFCVPTGPQQVEEFLRRSGNLPLDIHQYLEVPDHIEPFLSTTLHNLSRLRRLEINSSLDRLGRLLERFSTSAPVLEYLNITNYPNITDEDMKLPCTIFGGRLPKLTSLSLFCLRTDLRGFIFPSLTRFSFTTGTKNSVGNLIFFFEKCPLLEFIQICLGCMPEQPIAPPRKRVRLVALKELRFGKSASVSGLLDHLTLPNCTEMTLKGEFTGEVLNQYGSPAARIHPSSIDHLPVTRGITKVVAMPKSCILSGPNGNLRFWCFSGTRREFDAEYFTSFSPIPVLEIRELWVGQSTASHFGGTPEPWKQTAAGVRGAFGMLTKVEDLTIISCETGPIFATLDATVDDTLLLPRLRRLTIHVGCGNLDVAALVQCTKTRKERSRPLGEVTVVFTEAATTDLIREVELLREFVVEVDHHVGVAPTLIWSGVGCDF